MGLNSVGVLEFSEERNRSSNRYSIFVIVCFFILFYFILRLTIYYTRYSGRPWYLQHSYLNNKKKKKKEEREKKDGKSK